MPLSFCAQFPICFLASLFLGLLPTRMSLGPLFSWRGKKFLFLLQGSSSASSVKAFLTPSSTSCVSRVPQLLTCTLECHWLCHRALFPWRHHCVTATTACVLSLKPDMPDNRGGLTATLIQKKQELTHTCPPTFKIWTLPNYLWFTAAGTKASVCLSQGSQTREMSTTNNQRNETLSLLNLILLQLLAGSLPPRLRTEGPSSTFLFCPACASLMSLWEAWLRAQWRCRPYRSAGALGPPGPQEETQAHSTRVGTWQPALQLVQLSCPSLHEFCE